MNNRNKINKLEIHRYAPELNKLHFNNGSIIKVSGVTSIKDYRKNISKKRLGKYCKLEFINTNLGNKVYAGFINNYTELNTFIKTMKKKHNLSTGLNISIRYIQS